MKKRLLVVDDDTTFREVLARELEDLDYEVRSCGDGVEALEACKDRRPDAALLDLRMPLMGGLELMRRLHQLDRELPVVMLTGHGAVPDAVAAIREGAYDFLSKPVTHALLQATLARAVEHRSVLDENQRLRRLTETDFGHELLGESAPMDELRDLIRRVARSSAPVLIQGESGTGKELVARQLHAQSPRSTKPFVVLNCGAIAESLVASELFGHEKGAFTGAERRRRGLIEAAEGGTVFLDEIGELPKTLQPALLRTIQFGEVRPVGSETIQQVDVRFLAATHRNLLREVEEERFREDLYFRLAPLQIEVPPLRDRAEDVGVLARAFLMRESQRDDRDLRLSEEALEELRRKEWRGNVRELENAVLRLAALADGPDIGVADIERFVSSPEALRGKDLPSLDIATLERMALEAGMKRYDGDKRKVAAALGVSLKTVYNKLSRFGLE